MKLYTVLLLYAESDTAGETYQAHVMANDPKDAYQAAIVQLSDANDCTDEETEDEMMLLAIYEGHLTDFSGAL